MSVARKIAAAVGVCAFLVVGVVGCGQTTKQPVATKKSDHPKSEHPAGSDAKKSEHPKAEQTKNADKRKSDHPQGSGSK